MESIQRWRRRWHLSRSPTSHRGTDWTELAQLRSPGLKPEEDRLTKVLQNPEHQYVRDLDPIIMEKTWNGIQNRRHQ